MRKSQVLLKNAGNVLPLATRQQPDLRGRQERRQHRQPERRLDHLLAGRQRATITPGTTILQGIRNTVGAVARTVTYNATASGIDSTYRAAIAVVGETPYAEGEGDRPGGDGPGHRPTCNTITTLRNAGRAGGRGAGLRPAAGHRRPAAATGTRCVAAWLPGTEGAGRRRRAVRRRRADRQAADDLDASAEPAADQRRRRQDAAVRRTGSGSATARPSRRRSAFTQIQAESYNAQSGTQLETTTDTGGGQNVGYIAPGDWLAYDLDFGAASPASVTTRIASGATASGTIQYRLDSTTGPVIASVPVSRTGGWQTWTSRDHQPVRGGHRRAPALPDVHRHRGRRLRQPQLVAVPAPAAAGPTRTACGRRRASARQSGTQTETTTGHRRRPERRLDRARRLARLRQCGLRLDLGGLGDRPGSRPGATASGTIQYRLDSTTGPIIASVPVSNTGGWQSWTSATTQRCPARPPACTRSS